MVIFDQFGKELWRDDSVANLYGANLTRANLTRANLTRANLTGADLYGASLTGANLTGADLYGANLTGANLTRANLTGANLTRANLTGANLTRANLTGANLTGADLYGANLTRANLTRANLTGANLTGADLYGADLYGADLYGANLTRANLTGANLTRANLAGATGYNPWRCDALRILLAQPGKIHAYKIVTHDYTGPIHAGIEYTIGATIIEKDCNSDESTQCGAGINLATLPYVLNEYVAGRRILVVEFKAGDIVAIPHGTDGKFRVKRCKVLRELTDAEYAEYGVKRDA